MCCFILTQQWLVLLFFIFSSCEFPEADDLQKLNLMQIRNRQHNALSVIMQSYATGVQCMATRADIYNNSRYWVHSEHASC